jgi:hypothetical protein
MTKAVRRKQFVLGRADFLKISAVEGIRIEREMAEDFRHFDDQELCAADRRKAIKRKYGKVRG